MANLFERSTAWLNGAMQEAAGVTVVYRRAGQPDLILEDVAWVGRTLFSVAQPGTGGNRVVWGERDYLVPAAAIAALGEPERGDRIAETLAGDEVTFEAIPPAGEPVWRWSDEGRTVYRIHCKEAG